MAQDLFKRLTRNDPLERYTADQALRHPWITRHSSETPPLTYLEKLNYFNNKLKIRRILFTVLLLSTIKPKEMPIPKDFNSEREMPQIKLEFLPSNKTNRRKHASMIITNPRSISPKMKNTPRLNTLRNKYPKFYSNDIIN